MRERREETQVKQSFFIFFKKYQKAFEPFFSEILIHPNVNDLRTVAAKSRKRIKSIKENWAKLDKLASLIANCHVDELICGIAWSGRQVRFIFDIC